MKHPFLFLSILLLFIMNNLLSHGQIDNSQLFDSFEYRNLGPFRVGAWLSDITAPQTEDPSYKYTFYIAARSGGVWKTINNGTTFTPIFDEYGTNSIGAIEVAPSNPEILWVGTGESYNARSTHAGIGIFKSENGGENFEFKGLEDSHHISRILIHPTNPDIVYVAVMGHLFSANEQRGVFKTTDGGTNWEKVLYVNDKIGVIDLVINPSNPEILFAATYDKVRLPWHYEAGGPESGIYKTTDGGLNWERLSGGLPDGNIGRIGLTIYQKNPEILYTVIENLNQKPDYVDTLGDEFDHMRDPYYDQLVGGEVYKTIDGGTTWEKRNASDENVSSKAAYSFNGIMVDPANENNLFINSISVITSHDGGLTWYDETWPAEHLFVNMFGDIRSMWINPKDSRHVMMGSDGGLFITYDGGKTQDHLYNIPLGEMYTIEVDNAYPYNVYAGLQDHEVWKGPSNSWFGEIGLEEWHIAGMWDGMYFKVDPTNRWAYFTSQFGAHHRVDQLKGERVNIQPKRAEGSDPYRFPWTPPIIISPHNSDILYTGGQVLLRSLNKGDTWEEISPDLTTNNADKIAGRGHMMYCTITSISESPIKAGVIWVGTDDGRVHMTTDHGKTWKEFTTKIAEKGVPENRWVSRVWASSHEINTAFVCKSGFRNDDFEPYIFKTIDNGETWKKITTGLPNFPVNVISEDIKNPDLLFTGTDNGIYVSLNSGETWDSFNQNMPPVPVKDIVIHPKENDLVAATYGRGIFITDISPLQEINDEILSNNIHVFNIEPKPSRNYSQRRFWGNYKLYSDRHLFTPNEENGIMIYYHLNDIKKQNPEIKILDIENNEIEKVVASNNKGMNKVIWETSSIEPGIYFVDVRYGKQTITKRCEVKAPPQWPVGHGF